MPQVYSFQTNSIIEVTPSRSRCTTRLTNNIQALFHKTLPVVHELHDEHPLEQEVVDRRLSC